MATTILDRLRQNDPTLTKLKLVQSAEEYYTTNDNNKCHDLEELLAAIRGNHTVRYVLFEHRFVRSLEVEQWVDVLQAVGQMAALEEIEIWSTRVPLEELCQAIQHSTKLMRLGFGFVTLLGNLSADALCRHPSLQNVYLSDFRLADHGLVSEEEEEDGAIPAPSLNSLFYALSTCPKMQYIELFQFQQDTPPFTASGVAQLMESHSLQHLTLRRMGLTAELSADLALALGANNHNNNDDNSAPSSCPSLKVLNLNENQLGDEGCAALGRSLAFHRSVKELDLRKNQISPVGCLQLARSLTDNTILEKLNLACNPLEDTGAQGLALLLQVHPCLKSLELHRTQLTDVGCRTLAETLRHNTCLVNLDVSFNDITEAAYVHVADALKVNETLKSINLQVNKKMKLKACEALLSMVKENFVLESISTLMRVRFEPSEYHQFEDSLHQINLYLRLNHAGRRRLLHGEATLQEWGTSLLAVHDDLNGLYYFLNANPSLVCRLMMMATSATNNTGGVLGRHNHAGGVDAAELDGLVVPVSVGGVVPACLPVVR